MSKKNNQSPEAICATSATGLSAQAKILAEAAKIATGKDIARGEKFTSEAQEKLEAATALIEGYLKSGNVSEQDKEKLPLIKIAYDRTFGEHGNKSPAVFKNVADILSDLSKVVSQDAKTIQSSCFDTMRPTENLPTKSPSGPRR